MDGTTGGTRTVLRCYAADGSQLAASNAPAASNGLSFVGISFNAGEQVARVVLESGNVALSAATNDGGSNDVVVMDDFIYGEPQPIEYSETPSEGSSFPGHDHDPVEVPRDHHHRCPVRIRKCHSALRAASHLPGF